MTRRCDQVPAEEPNCRDRSDEKGCQLIVFKDREGYNARIPPFESQCGVVIQKVKCKTFLGVRQ